MAIVYPAVIIGFVAFFLSVIGVKVGPLLGRIVGKRAEFLGGLILLFIGIKILFDHL
ncbi:MAG: manganese efflux pump [Candidatus Aminicenantes bacterium]